MRPTSSKVRQAFFNILGQSLAGKSFLDLFAGTGLMGMEALSRGAGPVLFVEENHHSVAAIKQSLADFHLEESGSVLRGDVLKILSGLSNCFDIIYADPPYKKRLGPAVSALLCERTLLSDNGLLIIEHRHDDPLEHVSGSLVMCDHRQYGQTGLSFFRWNFDA